MAGSPKARPVMARDNSTPISARGKAGDDDEGVPKGSQACHHDEVHQDDTHSHREGMAGDAEGLGRLLAAVPQDIGPHVAADGVVEVAVPRRRLDWG